MKLNEYKLTVESGNGSGTGLIGRFPSVVLLVVGEAESSEQTRLIDLFSNATGPADDLDRRLDELLAGESPIEGFAAVVENGRGASLYLHGPVEATAEAPNGQFRFWGPSSGEQPVLRYDAPPSLGSLTVRRTDGNSNGNGNGNGHHAGLSFDLRTGLVSGSGLVLERRDATPMAEPMSNGAAVNGSAPATATNGNGAAHAPAMNGAGTNGAAVAPAPPPQPAPPPSFPRMAPAGNEPPAWLASPAQAAMPSAKPAAASRSDRPRPNYLSRLLTRLLVTVTLGLGATFLLGPLLPVGFAPLGDTYLMGFVALATLFVTGAGVLDWIYGLLQRARTDQDWPAPLLALQAIPEGLLAWGVIALFLDAFVVTDAALLIDVAIVAVVVALGTYGLSFVPATRRVLLRAGTPAPVRAPRAGVRSSGQVAPAAAAPTNVWGINCQQGHFNRPDARYCGSCGTAMHGLTHQPLQGPRPTLGYLVSDDGSAYPLDGDYVVGRAPESDGKVRGALARALPVPDGTLSDAHADIHLDEWDVTIVDRGHPSGTYVREPDSTNAIRLSPAQPFTIRSGTHVRVGQRELVFHALNSR